MLLKIFKQHLLALSMQSSSSSSRSGGASNGFRHDTSVVENGGGGSSGIFESSGKSGFNLVLSAQDFPYALVIMTRPDMVTVFYLTPL
jgi:hypothetical protein